MRNHENSTKIPLGAAAAVTGAVLVGLAAWSQGRPAAAIRRAFRAWGNGDGSIYDLMDADTEVVIPGSAPHCGSWRKDAFLREVAAPFGARFVEPPLPRLRALWTGADGIVAQADATGKTRDGQLYANDYFFLFEMKGQRITRVTEFLDMAAFNTVWDTVDPEPAHAG